MLSSRDKERKNNRDRRKKNENKKEETSFSKKISDLAESAMKFFSKKKAWSKIYAEMSSENFDSKLVGAELMQSSLSPFTVNSLHLRIGRENDSVITASGALENVYL